MQSKVYTLIELNCINKIQKILWMFKLKLYIQLYVYEIVFIEIISIGFIIHYKIWSKYNKLFVLSW